jgi:hypothetical protein
MPHAYGGLMRGCGRSRSLSIRSGAAVAALIVLLALLSGPAHAQAAPPLRVLIRPSLLTEITSQVLPMELTMPADESAVANQPLILTELLYCGSDESGKGIMIGVIDEGPHPLRPRSLAASDCQQPLAAIAARELRVPGAPEWVEAAHVRLSWRSWQLTLAVANTAPAAQPGFTAPQPAASALSRSFSTNNLQPLTGAGRNLSFDLAVAFLRNGVVIDAYPSGSAANPRANFPASSELASQLQNLPPDTNVIAAARYPFINQVLSIYAPTFNVPVSVQGLSAVLLARNLTVSGGENQVTLKGQVISQSAGQNLAYDTLVDAAGDDLTVQQVTMDAAGASCAQPDMMTWLQCQAGRGLAAALTAYYQNQPLHISTRSRPLHFTFGGNDYAAFFTALKTSSHNGALNEAGQAVLQRDGTPGVLNSAGGSARVQ